MRSSLFIALRAASVVLVLILVALPRAQAQSGSAGDFVDLTLSAERRPSFMRSRGGGVGGSGGAREQLITLPLVLTLRLESTVVERGSEAAYVLEVEHSGSEPLLFPWGTIADYDLVSTGSALTYRASITPCNKQGPPVLAALAAYRSNTQENSLDNQAAATS